MNKPRLLDLFSGAGGAAVGYHRAGFEVVGVDIELQPNFPFEFERRDALTLLARLVNKAAEGQEPDFLTRARPLEPTEVGFLGDFDAIHASPPCQAYTALRTLQGDKDYPDLVGPTRELFIKSGLPYVIENVVGAPLVNPIQLCGSSFGLRIRRHRLFETNFALMAQPCAHHWQQDKIFPALNGEDRKRGGRSGIVGVYGNGGDKRADLWAKEMSIDWMTRKELTEAIPPAYTEHIGHYLMTHLQAQVAA